MAAGTAPAAARSRSALLESLIRPGSKRITVNPGQSIQAAIDKASPGDTVVVNPGTYRETGRACAFKTSEMCAVSITKDNITLVGLSGNKPVTLANPTGLSIGIGIGKYYACKASYYVSGTRVFGFSVTGFNDTGIEGSCIQNWDWGYDSVSKCKIYEFYPVWARNGHMHDSVATDATDTGFYVGISENIHVDHNVAYNNVSGYEFENTTGSLMDHNTAYFNTGGILMFIIPGDPMERSYNNVVSDNVVTQNNNANKCTGGTVCSVPPGTGLLIIGGHNNQVLRNSVTMNDTYGIGMTDVCTAFTLTPAQCKALKYNPDTEQTRVVANVVLENGLDLAWLPQYGTGNCWSRNRAATKSPSNLPKC